MTIRINKRSIFYFLLTVLLVLVLMRYGFQIELPRIVITLIVIAIAFLGDKTEILAISMCCIPLHNAVDFYLAIFMCAVIYIFKNSDSMRFNLSTILAVIMIVWELLHCFSADFDVKLFLMNISPLIFLVMIMNMDVAEIEYAFIARMLSIATISMSIVLLTQCFVQANYSIIGMLTNMKRLGMVSEDILLLGTGINPNTLGIISVLSASSLFQIRHTTKKKSIDFVMIALLIISCLLTASRTALVCLIVMILLILMGQQGTITQKFRNGVAILAITVAVVLVYWWLFPENFAYFVHRFESDSTGSGRSLIFAEYQKYMNKHLWVMFFGVGLNNFGEKVTNIYNMSTAVPHMGIQEIVVAWGIPGLILIAILLVMMIIESKRYSGRKTLMNYIPLIIILTKSMAGQMITSSYTMLALGFAYLSLCQDFHPTVRLDNESL